MCRTALHVWSSSDRAALGAFDETCQLDCTISVTCTDGRKDWRGRIAYVCDPESLIKCVNVRRATRRRGRAQRRTKQGGGADDKLVGARVHVRGVSLFCSTASVPLIYSTIAGNAPTALSQTSTRLGSARDLDAEREDAESRPAELRDAGAGEAARLPATSQLRHNGGRLGNSPPHDQLRFDARRRQPSD